MTHQLASFADVDEFHAFTETGMEAAVLDVHGYVWVVTESDRGELWAHRVDDEADIAWKTLTLLAADYGPLTVIHDPRKASA